MDDKEKQEKQKADAEAKAEAELLEKILQDILADDENIYYFLIPLVLQEMYQKERHIISHVELRASITLLKENEKALAEYKERLKKKISFNYIYACGLLFTNTSNLRASELLRTYANILYDINKIEDKKIRKIKTLFFQDYINERLTNLGDIFLKITNGFKAISKSNTKIMTADDEEYSKIINSIDYETFKFKDNIKSKDDVLAFMKKQENNEKIFYAIQRKLEDFSDYLLGTGTDGQTLKDYDNRFKDNTMAEYLDKNGVLVTRVTGIFYSNIYTNYDTKTDDGLKNYNDKTDAIDKQYNELWQRIYDNKGDITLDEISKLLSFNADEKNILKDAEAVADAEKIGIPTKPNSYTYVTNKVHRNLDKIETLTEIDKDLLPISLSKNRGDIVITASMDTMQDAIYKLNLSNTDKLVLEALKSLFKNNKAINLEAVFDYVTGNAGDRPNPTTLQDIEKSILNLSGKRISLNYATTKHFKGKTKGEQLEIDFTAPLLSIEKVAVKYKGGKHTFYKLVGTYEDNRYFKFIDDIGQLASTKTLYLNNGGKVRNTTENILITHYLVEQITLMRSGSLDTNKISYDKIYALCGVDDTADPTEAGKLAQRKNRIRANVALILKEKKKQGLILDYKEYKLGAVHRVAGVEIFTENDKKK